MIRRKREKHGEYRRRMTILNPERHVKEETALRRDWNLSERSRRFVRPLESRGYLGR